MYFRVFVLKNEPQYEIYNHFNLYDESSGEYYQFSYDNEFRRLIRMMAGVDTDLRTSIPQTYRIRVKSVLTDLIDYGIFPTSVRDDFNNLNQFCYDPKRRSDFLDRMEKEVRR